MYPHLLGQKELCKLSNEAMANIIGCTRQTYENKMANGKFTAEECFKFCKRFNKPFDYLFVKNDDLPCMTKDGEVAEDL